MSLLEPVAHFAYRRRVPLLILFALMFAGGVAYGRGTAHELVASGFEDPSSESARADLKLDERFGLGTPDIVAVYSHPQQRPVNSPEFERLLAPVLERIRTIPGVQRVGTPYGATPDALVSDDGKRVVSTIRLAGTGRAVQESYDLVAPHLRVQGLDTLLGGSIPASREAQHAAEADLVRAELITLPLVAILLVVFFRGVILALLPLAVGAFSVALALACVRLLTHFVEVSVFAMNIVTFVGLGVAIDYSLFIASRFRDELHAGVPTDRALAHTLRTAGRTVGYSGGAVAVSLLALTVFPMTLLRSVALAGSLVVMMSLVGALILLPAMLAALGHRIDWLSFGQKKTEDGSHGYFHRIAETVMRRPLSVTVAVTALLVALGLPFLRIQAAVSGAAVLPAHAEARQVAELLEGDHFPQSATNPVEIFVSLERKVLTPEGLETLERYVQKIERLPHVKQVTSAVGGSSGHSAAQLSQVLNGPGAQALESRLAPLVRERDAALRVASDVSPDSAQGRELVAQIRALDVPGVQAMVSSQAARLADLRSALARHFPVALAVICAATFVVLFLAFGSVVMPIKAIVMNVLSLTASFGALVWIFQEGRLESLLDFKSPGNIELTIPVVMFAVVFGLAMDYELFLLSRIRESYDRTHDTKLSVTEGLEHTGQLITRAALLLVAVMIGFISADMLLVKELGVGMAIAVIVDATVVRALLVPATMQLLGHYNWWAPSFMAKWWKRHSLGVDERSPEELEHGEPRLVEAPR
jgi:uncharacterized membrane protein YdfJ with MMPL/SSD domain